MNTSNFYSFIHILLKILRYEILVKNDSFLDTCSIFSHQMNTAERKLNTVQYMIYSNVETQEINGTWSLFLHLIYLRGLIPFYLSQHWHSCLWQNISNRMMNWKFWVKINVTEDNFYKFSDRWKHIRTEKFHLMCES